jgi:hypothetical protein
VLVVVLAVLSIGAAPARFDFTLYAVRPVEGRLELRAVDDGGSVAVGDYLQLEYNNPLDQSWSIQFAQLEGDHLRVMVPGDLEVGSWHAEARRRDAIGVPWLIDQLAEDVREITLIVVATDSPLSTDRVASVARAALLQPIPDRSNLVVAVHRYAVPHPAPPVTEEGNAP